MVIDPDLVKGMFPLPADIPEPLFGEKPVLAHFRREGFDLWYLGSLHEFRMDSRTFRLLERVYSKFPVARVVVEGRTYDNGDVPESDIKHLREEIVSGSLTEGERGYAILCAAERKIAAVGGEPTDRAMADHLIARGFTPQDVLGQMVVSWVPLWRRQGVLGQTSIAVLVTDMLKPQRREYGIDESIPFGYEDFLGWYRKANEEEFNSEVVGADFERSAPYPDGRFRTQRISHEGSLLRNRFIASALTRELERHRRVLAVFGSGHLWTHWRALQAAFGNPVYCGDLL